MFPVAPFRFSRRRELTRRPRDTVPLTAAQQLLVTGSLALAKSILESKFFRCVRYPELWNRLTHASEYGLCLAALRFRSGSGAFTTFAYPTIHGTIVNELRIFNRRPPLYSLNVVNTSLVGAAANDEWEPREADHSRHVECPRHPSALDSAVTRETVSRVSRAIRSLDATDAVIFRLRYGLAGEPELGPRDIAVRLGITRQRVHQRLARARQRFSDAYLRCKGV